MRRRMESGRIWGRGIEWDAVRGLLAREARTAMGRERALEASPLTDLADIHAELELTREARAALMSAGVVTTAARVFRGGSGVTKVIVEPDESFENALKRFKKQCEKAGLLSEFKKRQHYEKPSVRRKRKALAARKKAKRRERMAD